MKNDVVILVIAHKSVLNEFEIISLKQLYKILGHYPIKFICPRGLDVSFYKEIINKPEFDFIDPCWQATYANFNKLKISPLLYKKYQYYKYILFYEPDAYVFRDELSEWCAKGYDYIGAPWFEGWHDATPTSKFIGVGNGGFSLRNVSTALNVWSWRSYFKIRKSINELWYEMLERNQALDWYRKIGSFKYFVLQFLGKNNNTRYYIQFCSGNEDVFWTEYIPKYFKKYKVAPFKDAIQFSFETNPSKLYHMNNNKLPFGCHAWMKYEYEEFWYNFIRKK